MITAVKSEHNKEKTLQQLGEIRYCSPYRKDEQPANTYNPTELFMCLLY